jgi:hypothetical protein
MIYSLLYCIVVAVVALPWIAFMLPFILLVSIWLCNKTVAAVRETVRL